MRHMILLVILPLFGIVPFFGQIVIGEENFSVNGTMAQTTKNLSRKKRYLAFPTGSNFVTTITLLKAIQIKEPKNWNLDFEFDMIWPIPNQEKLYKSFPFKRIKTYHRTRRHKRDLYANIELALEGLGLPGTECVLRTICEARIYLNSPGVSFLEDILRIILSHEVRGNKLDKYDIAYSNKKIDCDLEYPCPISILELILNYDPEFFVE